MNWLALVTAAILGYMFWRTLHRGGDSFRRRALAYLMAAVAVALVVAMVFYPEDAFNSAVSGLVVWWDVVFPALLPFFIGSEILMGLGVVHFMGVLLEPFMRPVFNLPGVGSFVMAMGLASGYPIGCILTCKLRRQNMVSKTDGERLMSVANTADPLFMAGAVAVGMFGMPEIGGVIMAAHYLSALAVGVLLRFWRPRADRSPARDASRGNILVRALNTLYEARLKDARPIGQLMGDAIRQSVNNLLLIGGFIILFSVIIRIMTIAGVVEAVAGALSALLAPFGVDTGVAPALVSGLFEITLGTRAASQAAAPLVQKVIAASAIIGWSGLSVHGQVASISSDTDMDIGIYIFARAVHAVLAGVTTFLLLGPAEGAFGWLSRPALSPAVDVFAPGLWLARLQTFSLWFVGLSAALLALGLVAALFRKGRLISFRLPR